MTRPNDDAASSQSGRGLGPDRIRSLLSGRDRPGLRVAGARVFGAAVRGCETGVSCRSGSVNGTNQVDSRKAVQSINKDAFPDLFSIHAVTDIFSGPRCRLGESGGGRERPPCFASRIGTAGGAVFIRAVPLGRVAPVPSIPGGKAFGSPERVGLPPTFGDST